ncbi:Amino acid permease 2 [Auxenochlorella protothecoides]|uniref:Amino acid permease 2 n=1 Tax=Auxenochlorella protothecoides TaxID=3075 RepID=A0A087SHM6_AUXPR|nr:Amino acid permease 2 [Auxenochlorella protothecoides]KFM25230.1 Amino acid permease 2 [Auxenochlorella protothecoides]
MTVRGLLASHGLVTRGGLVRTFANAAKKPADRFAEFIASAGARQGDIRGIQANAVNKVFGVMNALGAIAFAYSFSIILLEIQDTLRQPPKASKTMKPAAMAGISAAFAFYFTVAVVNYSAFGNNVSGFILDAYPGPKWLLVVGYVCILLHMVSAYQVFGQPIFDTIESHIKAFHLKRAQAAADAEALGKGAEELRRIFLRRMSPAVSERLSRLSATASMYRMSTGFANEAVPLNEDHYFLPLWQRLLCRTLYVILTTVVAIVMPFFTDMAGLVGALTFFPLSIFLPIRCWRVLYHPTGAFSALLWFVEISMGIVCACATVASVRGIILNWTTYKLFAS